MAAEPVPSAGPVRDAPAHAWAWLQRSRPVVERLADVLTGQPSRAGFVDAVRRSYVDDPLVRDAVHGVVAEVAFRGRVPPRRPPGASWDRGLVWWAATLVGRTPEDYAASPATVEQPALFAEVDAPAVDPERAMLIAALEDLLAQRSGDQIPAAAVRQLVVHLRRGPERTDPHR
ncbi:MAG TPA: hypothetical protein VFZ70_10725 [Euzebyales bacterium]